MVSSAIIHVIGTSMLVMILLFVIIHTSTSTYLLIISNEKDNLEKIANSIALQITYTLYINTNTSIELNYPIVSIYNSEYNIIIGSGSSIKSLYPFIKDLDDDSIYVIAFDPANNVYAYAFLASSTSTPSITVEPDPKIFSSSSIAIVEKIIEGNNIVLRCHIVGWKIS